MAIQIESVQQTYSSSPKWRAPLILVGTAPCPDCNSATAYPWCWASAPTVGLCWINPRAGWSAPKARYCGHYPWPGPSHCSLFPHAHRWGRPLVGPPLVEPLFWTSSWVMCPRIYYLNTNLHWELSGPRDERSFSAGKGAVGHNWVCVHVFRGILGLVEEGGYSLWG